eukprot:TRINITY_DN306_c4_g1_i1.p1 TRINITY_DN306_c4_g1~~TRINITY_DN306_c4_g1_i1.p1  ORF type:complete len:123 (-),score=36.50 TRINITY_DN306_c4_g1_i1:331-699(-)
MDMVHGDLTTSNIFVRGPLPAPPAHAHRPPPDASPEAIRSMLLSTFQVVPIDFGLSFTSTMVEDKAVDLYVLERAFISSHAHSEELFARVLEAYGKESKKSRAVLKRLEAVRARGRKKLAFG